MKGESYPRKREERNAPVEARPTTQTTPIPQKPQTLYLKVENMTGDAFRRVCSILEIFEGTLPVIFFDGSTKKYIKANGLSTDIQPTMLKLLKMILGDSAVVLK
jgi:hypothetical protein